MTHDNELLPCPFCGGRAIHQNDAQDGDMYFKEWVSCSKCGARMLEDIIDDTQLAWNTRTPPPPSGDAVRLAVEALERVISARSREINYVEKLSDLRDCDGKPDELQRMMAASGAFVINNFRELQAFYEFAPYADLILSALRALPATPVNPPSAERGDALEALEFLTDGEVYTTNGLKAYNVVRAALLAPVGTRWIDEMRRTVSQCPTSDYAKGHADALDAVKQKLDGRG